MNDKTNPSARKAYPVRESGLDKVQEASEESFPASDVPSWTPTTGVGQPLLPCVLRTIGQFKLMKIERGVCWTMIDQSGALTYWRPDLRHWSNARQTYRSEAEASIGLDLPARAHEPASPDIENVP